MSSFEPGKVAESSAGVSCGGFADSIISQIRAKGGDVLLEGDDRLRLTGTAKGLQDVIREYKPEIIEALKKGQCYETSPFAYLFTEVEDSLKKVRSRIKANECRELLSVIDSIRCEFVKSYDDGLKAKNKLWRGVLPIVDDIANACGCFAGKALHEEVTKMFAPALDMEAFG